MAPHRKTCPHMVHFNVPRDWFETNSRHKKRYSEGDKKNRGCRGLLGRVIVVFFKQYNASISVKPEGGTPSLCGAFDLYCLPHPREFE